MNRSLFFIVFAKNNGSQGVDFFIVSAFYIRFTEFGNGRQITIIDIGFGQPRKLRSIVPGPKRGQQSILSILHYNFKTTICLTVWAHNLRFMRSLLMHIFRPTLQLSIDAISEVLFNFRNLSMKHLKLIHYRTGVTYVDIC